MHSTSTRKTTGAGRRVITTLAAFGALLPLCLVLASEAPAQTRTVGLFQNDSRAYPGYTLFSPKQPTRWMCTARASMQRGCCRGSCCFADKARRTAGGLFFLSPSPDILWEHLHRR